MDQIRNSQNARANLQFLKRFQGKTSIMTKEGLINLLLLQNSRSSSSLSQIAEKVLPQPHPSSRSNISKLITTQPAVSLNFEDQTSLPKVVRESVLKKEKGEKRYSQGNEKYQQKHQKGAISNINNQKYSLNLDLNQIRDSQKFPQIMKSKSVRTIEAQSTNRSKRSKQFRQEGRRSTPKMKVEDNQIRREKGLSFIQRAVKFQNSLRQLKFNFSSVSKGDCRLDPLAA